METLAEKLIEFVHTPWAPFLLSFHAMLESFFLPGAHDILLVAVCVARLEWCFIFAAFSTVGSVIGGSLGYSVGRFGGRPVIERFLHFKFIDTAEEYFNKYGVWAIAIGGFTPLPYKIIGVASGIFEIPFWKFFIVSFFARAGRFITVSAILYIIGPSVKKYLISYFNAFSIFLLIMAIAVYFIYKVVVKRYENE